MVSHFPYEVIEKVVESLMWGLQEVDCAAGDQAKQLNSARRKRILREYAAIPLTSRSFRDAYLRFFTTLPALSYDALRAPGEVRLYRLPPSSCSSPSATTTVPYIVVAPGVAEMLAAKGRLGHLKWVHITVDLTQKDGRGVLGATPLESLYELLGVRNAASEGVLALDEAHVELGVPYILAIAFAPSNLCGVGPEWVLLNALGLNATSLHIGLTAYSIMAVSSSIDSSAPASFVSREADFNRITRLTLCAKVQTTWWDTSSFSSRDWAALLYRVLGMCSGCKELRWEFTDEDVESWGCNKTLRIMAEEVLPAIQSDVSILIHYNLTPNLADEKSRQSFFAATEDEGELFCLGSLVEEVGTRESGGEMTREIVLDAQRNMKSDGDEKKGETKEAGDHLIPTGEDGQGRRVLRWNIKYY